VAESLLFAAGAFDKKKGMCIHDMNLCHDRTWHLVKTFPSMSWRLPV